MAGLAPLSLRLRNRHFFVLDALVLLITPLLALLLRIDGMMPLAPYVRMLLFYTVLGFAVRLGIFRVFGLYRRYWRYASIEELKLIVLAVAAATAFLAMLFFVIQPLQLRGDQFPRSVPLIDGLLVLLAVGGTRFSVRAVASTGHGGLLAASSECRRVLVVGAGDAGALIVREMRNSARVNMEPVGFVDDDANKQGVSIYGVPVLGRCEDIPVLVGVHHIEEVIIAMPTAPGKVIREIVGLCESARVPSKTVPGMYEILSGSVGVSYLRKVQIEDLLRREPVHTDTAPVSALLRGRRVLVTGAGGSIGSELCRQIARCAPAELVLLGHGENSLFLIEADLRRLAPTLKTVNVVADIRDRRRLQPVFDRYRPEIVFHAAAHKHVPLMESNVEDAVTNNIFGTRQVVEVSRSVGVEHFVLISTDKAVNPTSVMGATKRVAELIVQQAARDTGHAFVAVRFGNVLGSRGSVVPFFQKQIADGGPVTVTHPAVTRYFMTIPEAVELVLQAAALGRGGEVFVLNMGEPVRIIDLAEDLIRLSGLEPGRDIEIKFTGLRPGEKLFEELFLTGERYGQTSHDKIFIYRNGVEHALPHAGACASLDQSLDELVAAAQQGDPAEVRRLLKCLVPEYDSPLAPQTPLSSEVVDPAQQERGQSSEARSRA